MSPLSISNELLDPSTQGIMSRKDTVVGSGFELSGECNRDSNRTGSEETEQINAIQALIFMCGAGFAK